MKRFRFYRGQPVKRMRQGPDGLILTMLAKQKGKPGTQLTVSQADWERDGGWREVPSTRLDDLRELVKT